MLIMAACVTACKKPPRTAIIRYTVTGYGTSNFIVDYLNDDRVTKREDVKYQQWDKTFTIEAGEAYLIRATDFGASYLDVSIYINDRLYDTKSTKDCNLQQCTAEISGIVKEYY